MRRTKRKTRDVKYANDLRIIRQTYPHAQPLKKSHRTGRPPKKLNRPRGAIEPNQEDGVRANRQSTIRNYNKAEMNNLIYVKGYYKSQRAMRLVSEKNYKTPKYRLMLANSEKIPIWCPTCRRKINVGRRSYIVGLKTYLLHMRSHGFLKDVDLTRRGLSMHGGDTFEEDEPIENYDDKIWVIETISNDRFTINICNKSWLSFLFSRFQLC